MSFHSPHLLWLLAPLLILFSWELARQTVRATAALWPRITRAWAGSFEVSLGARHTTAENRPRLWLWFGLACGIIALARPQWGVIEEQVFDQSREVLIAVDLSKSMLAQDVKPSRLDRSKLLIQSLLDGLQGERVGLVLFAGTAFLQSPLSSDYEILREFLPSMNPDYLPEGGSNYQAMLETSAQAFGTSTADRYLIVLSDGESTTDDWKKLADTLKQKSIRVIGLGVGTPGGSLIPDGSGGYVKDERGAVVMSRLNSSTLQELAQLTGGAYVDANAWVDLPALLKTTVEAGRKGEFSERNTARQVERYQWFLAPALLLLLLSFWSEFPVRPRERALPLAAKSQILNSKSHTIAAALLALLWLTALCSPLPALVAQSDQSDPLAKPLSTAVARLAQRDILTAKDYAELAETTLTYGQRAQSSQQSVPETVLRDGLQAVDLGEKLDTKAANWPQVREGLQKLLHKEEPPKEDKKQDEQQKNQQQDKKDQQKQDQDKQEQQDQNQNDQNRPQADQQQNQSKSDQQKSDNQQPNQSSQKPEQAFGDQKDQPKPQPDKKSPPPPQPGTQKVGGQQDKPPTEAEQNPALAMPLQKLDQVRNQDSPAKLQQLMQGQPQKPKAPAKDW